MREELTTALADLEEERVLEMAQAELDARIDPLEILGAGAALLAVVGGQSVDTRPRVLDAGEKPVGSVNSRSVCLRGRIR